MVTAAAAAWGASGIFITLIVVDSGMTATTLAFWRDLGTFLLLLAICALFRRRDMRIPRVEWPRLALMGVALGFFHISLNLGVVLNGPAITTVQQSAMPVIVILTARLVWQEPFTVRKIGAILLMITGTALVSRVLSSDRTGVTPASVAAGFAVPVLYAAWSIFGKLLAGRHAPEILLTYAFGIAAVVLLPFQWLLPSSPTVSAWTILWFAGLIGISSAFGFFAFTFGLKHLPAGVTSILVMSEILFVSVYAYIIFGDVMTRMELIGALLVILGVITLLERRRIPPSEC
jgi:drug/metabolite transporter (DMT)-like permease